MLNVVDTATKELTGGATTLGAAQKRIDIQKDATQSLMDSIDRGVGQLVDADMNQELTRLQALQVQQQLGIQALSIANSNSQIDPVALPRLIRRATASTLALSQVGPRFRSKRGPIAFDRQLSALDSRRPLTLIPH